MRRYDEVVMLIRDQIAAGTLRVGDRLPSVRQMSKNTGFSQVTVHRGYELLESSGVCEARPRSGFYVAKALTAPTAYTDTTSKRTASDPKSNPSHPSLVSWKGVSAFGLPGASQDLFTRSVLDRTLRQVLRRGIERIDLDPQPEGFWPLRREIARRQAQRGAVISPDDILITSSTLEAYHLCLDAFTSVGDAVLVESPSYYPMVAGLKNRALDVIELYSHPTLGVDPEQFEHLLQNNPVKAAIFMAAPHFPTGVTYSEDIMRALIDIARRYGVLIIENDMFGELNYGVRPARSLRQFDDGNTVVQFSSFSHTLSPAYGVGWVVAGPHIRHVLSTQFMTGATAADTIVQCTIAEHLGGRSYDRHLRILKSTLASRMQVGADLIEKSFPLETSVSQPDGGYMCWLRCPKTNAAVVARAAAADGIGMLAGPMFSIAGSFQNFIALNFSYPWTEENTDKLRRLGQLVKHQLTNA